MIRERIIERGSGQKEAIYNALIVLAIGALVGAVWTLGQSVTALQVNQQRDEKVLDALAGAKK